MSRHSVDRGARPKLDVCRAVAVCMGCEHWQIDATPRCRSDHGGQNAIVWAMGEAHNEHARNECPRGTEGRVLFNGQWAEPPKMADGKPASGVMAFHPLPRWWVWK